MDADTLCAVQEDLGAMSEFLATLRYITGNVSAEDEEKIYADLERVFGMGCKTRIAAQRDAVFDIFYNAVIYPRRHERRDEVRDEAREAAIAKGLADKLRANRYRESDDSDGYRGSI